MGRISEFLENLQSLLTDDRKALTAVDTILGNTEPLNAKTVKREEELLVQQYTAFDKLEEAIENGDTVIKSVAENPGAKMPAVIKFKKMERRTAVRVAMIEFQNAFDCTRNTRLTDVRRSKLLPKCRFDYVESLFVHVNMLSAWELYWKMNSTGKVISEILG